MLFVASQEQYDQVCEEVLFARPDLYAQDQNGSVFTYRRRSDGMVMAMHVLASPMPPDGRRDGFFVDGACFGLLFDAIEAEAAEQERSELDADIERAIYGPD